MGDLSADVRDTIRDIPDFPKEGILFKDITTVLDDPELFGRLIDWMSVQFDSPTRIVAIESRGFIFGSAMVQRLGCGLTLARKAGKLPHTTVSRTYDLEYGTATLEMHTDALKPGDKVVIVDDLLATGGTAKATIELCQELGAEVLGCVFLIELGFIPGRKALHGTPVSALVTY